MRSSNFVEEALEFLVDELFCVFHATAATCAKPQSFRDFLHASCAFSDQFFDLG